MVNDGHLRIFQQGVAVWNAWRVNNSDIRPNLIGASLNNLDLTGISLNEVDLTGADFTNSNLTNADFREADLTNAKLVNTDLTAADMQNADLTKANLSESCLNQTRLTHATLVEANLTDVKSIKANFVHANLVKATLIGAKLVNAKLSHAILSGADFRGATLDSAVLSQAIVTGASLVVAHLHNTQLNSAILQSVNFTGATLTKAKFLSADLTDAKLLGAVLIGADLQQANLTNANLKSAKFDLNTNLEGAIVDGCKVDRYGLECLKGYGGLMTGDRMDMVISDDVARLRMSYSGLLLWVHSSALVVFLFPYIWFLVLLWSRIEFFEQNSSGLAIDTLPVWKAFFRYIFNGGTGWQSDWNVSWSFGVFLIMIVYNAMRAILLFKAKSLELEEHARDLPVKFSLHANWQWHLVAGYFFHILLSFRNIFYLRDVLKPWIVILKYTANPWLIFRLSIPYAHIFHIAKHGFILYLLIQEMCTCLHFSLQLVPLGP